MTVRVLLVEDDQDFTGLVKWCLASTATPHKFEVHCESTLSGALAYLENTVPDVVISDLGLPDSVGESTVSILVSAAPGVPFVVLSGEDVSSSTWDVISFGAEDHLTKSQITPKALTNAILGRLQSLDLQPLA